MVVTCLRKAVLSYQGQSSYSNDFPTLQLASTFASEEIDPSQFYDATNPVTITGATSGVKAYVTGFQRNCNNTTDSLFELLQNRFR